jgi:hypothetical protein
MHHRLAEELATQHRAEIRAEAAGRRACERAARPKRQVRRRLGVALIRIGVRVASAPGQAAGMLNP